MRTSFVAMLLLLCNAGIALAQDETTTDQEAAWQAFKATHGEDWQIRWNEQTGVPEAIMQGLSQPFRGSPLQAATAFLSENASLFRMRQDLANLKHVKTLEDEGIHHVTFQQTHQDLLVEDAVYLVHIRENGQVDMANGTYYPTIEVSGNASLGEKQALATALKDAGPAAKLEESKAELVILPVEGGFRTTWKVTFKTSAPAGTWRYFIDAENGQVLDKQNLITPIFSPSEIASLTEERSGRDHKALPNAGEAPSLLAALGSSATGSGRVYKKHPDLSSPTYESLPRLKDPVDGTVWTLNGSYAAVRNEAGDEARSINGNFYYQPTDPHFAEVNLYHHVDRFRYYFWRPLGMNRFDHIRAHANAPYRSDLGPNAWYDPELFGVGEIYFNPDLPAHGTRDFAKEDKIIYHEYTHAVVDMINNDITNRDGEEGAISEGTPDYFAGSYTGRTGIGEYAVGFTVRDMANPNPSTYAQFINITPPPEGHEGADFWSAVLWDLRNASGMGASVTDRLVYGALYRLDSSPTFLEYRDALLEEDRSRYGSNHVCTIYTVFNARGIGTVCPLSPPSTPTNLTVTNDGTNGQYPQLTWTGSSGVTRYDVYRCLDNPLDSSDCLGNSGFTKIGSPGSLTSYTDYGIRTRSSCASSGTYYKAARYFVKAVNSAGQSGASNQDATCSNQAANKQDAVLAAQEGSLEGVPSEYALEAAYPNPFNPTTEIRYALPEAANVRLVVYDALGREVARLVDGPVGAGYRHATFDAANLPSGLYLYRLEAKGAAEAFAKTGRMVLVK